MTEPFFKSSISNFRVLKKMSPKSRGAIKLARRLGDSLVCVRYRTDDEGKYRYTTVELVVERSEIRHSGDATVSVKTDLFEAAVRARLLASGALWDPAAKVWHLPRRVAVGLELTDRIVRKKR